MTATPLHQRTDPITPTAGAPAATTPMAGDGLLDRPVRLARVAGLLYLALVALGVWAELVVRGSIRVAGDPTATAANIAAHEAELRLALGADIVMATVFVLLGLALFRLLHPVHARAATALLTFVAVGAGSILVNLTFHAGALIAVTDPTYSSAFGAQGVDALALLLLDLHHDGYVLGGVFFGLWLAPMGYVAYRSPMFPRVLGVALVVGAVAWVVDPVLAFTLPDAPRLLREAVSLPTAVAELSLMLYLLVRGVSPAGRSTPAGGSARSARTVLT